MFSALMDSLITDVTLSLLPSVLTIFWCASAISDFFNKWYASVLKELTARGTESILSDNECLAVLNYTLENEVFKEFVREIIKSRRDVRWGGFEVMVLMKEQEIKEAEKSARCRLNEI